MTNETIVEIFDTPRTGKPKATRLLWKCPKCRFKFLNGKLLEQHLIGKNGCCNCMVKLGLFADHSTKWNGNEQICLDFVNVRAE